MTAPRRKAAYVASLVGAAFAGFGGHWVLPGVVRDAPAAQAAPESIAATRLLAIELKLEEITRQMGNMNSDMRAVKCRLNIEGVCPPEHSK